MTTRYSLPSTYDRAAFEAKLASAYSFAVEPTATEHRTYYDTFDWRLHDKSLSLHHGAGQLALTPVDGDGRASVIGFDGPLRFSSDLPSGTLQTRLLKVAKVRALLPVADVHLESHSYRVLNRDEKTVARLIYTKACRSGAPHEQQATFVELRPVRGYPKHERKLAGMLADIEEGSARHSDLYLFVLGATGRTPGDYSSRLALELDPDMPSYDAERMVMHRLVETMRANEEGIRDDTDTEFLHDFRIAVRRTRSALSQFQYVFPDDETLYFKHRFRQLFRRTNLLRDLDVYLLAEPAYRGMLPSSMRHDIDPLFAYLRSQRALAHREVVATLDSDDYENLMREWLAFLEGPTEPGTAGANAEIPVSELASSRIRKRFRRIVRDGTNILDHTEDELLHDLRLECKKLRYLLEFFAGLYPPKRVKRLIRQLKQLQDNLGEFVDLSVQQSHLLTTVDELPVIDANTRRALVATGVLVETMSRRQDRVKAEFADTFRAFAAARNRRDYERLFGGDAGRQAS